MNKYWIRWTQSTEDYRPLIDEFEYWCSGYDSFDQPILCCLIEAETEEKAIELISHGWPADERSAFSIDEKPMDWEPSDRFPRKGSIE
jgi:hypothetical protein